MGLFIASMVVWTGTAYSAIGLTFAVAFVTKGVAKVDHAATNAPWSFRLLIVPGVAALWPWMLGRWIIASKEASQ